VIDHCVTRCDVADSAHPIARDSQLIEQQLSGMMAVAYFQVHAPRGFWTIQNGGELAALYCFVFLYLSAAGGGPWSLDSIWRGVKS